MVEHRIINQQEEHRFVEILEHINLVHPENVNIPFGNFLRATKKLDLTTVEIDKSAQMSLDVLFKCDVSAATGAPPGGGTEYTLLFFGDRIADEIVVSPITVISITTTVVSGTSQTIDMLGMMGDFVNQQLYWCTDARPGINTARIWRGDYDANGAITNIVDIHNNFNDPVMGIWVDAANDLVYFLTGSQKFKKVVISTGGVTEIATLLAPDDLWLANSTLMYIALGSAGVRNIVKYNLVTDVASNVFAGTEAYNFVDGDFSRDFVLYRRRADRFIRKNDLTFLNEDSTWVDNGEVGREQDFNVDRLAQKVYYIDTPANQVVKVNYDTSGQVVIGTLISPGDYRYWTLG